jgi:hypothetical protein
MAATTQRHTTAIRRIRSPPLPSTIQTMLTTAIGSSRLSRPAHADPRWYLVVFCGGSAAPIAASRNSNTSNDTMTIPTSVDRPAVHLAATAIMRAAA